MNILHLDSNHPILIDKLASAGFDNVEDYRSDKASVERMIGTFDGIVIRSRFTIDRAFIDAAQNLKFIARVGAGLENIDTEYAAQRGIALIAAPEGNRNAVGEHALGMLLSLFNKLNVADREIRQGQWNRESNRGHELDGKTVGIIGYGNMGKAFAKKLRGFDVEVICHDILPHVGDANAKQVTLEELQQKADVLSLHIPWNHHTDRKVDAAFIDAFAKPFWLLNTSRGKNVVTADLVNALQSGKVLGAGLDVLEYEKSSFETLFTTELPEPLQFLMKADNVLLSPHVAGWTFESHVKLATVIADKILALASGTAYEVEQEKRVTGLGGFFFKSRDPKALLEWYRKHLGLATDAYGCSFWWRDEDGNKAMTQWSPFPNATEYFSPSEKPFMQNFRVQNLSRLLDQLQSEGVTVMDKTESYDYGHFAWIIDPEGNKIELWEPKDAGF